MTSGFPFMERAPLSIPDRIDILFYSLTALSGLVVLGIFGAIIYFCTKYHYTRKVDRSYTPAGQWKLEITWSILPLFIFIGIFYWGTRLYLDIFSPPKNATEILVVGKQWMWKFQHSDGLREVGILHIPVGQPIKLTMTSEDVIHSLFIPEFRIKQDVLPGRYTSVWFTATQSGQYHLFCTQYCGTAHALMGNTTLIALSPVDYVNWSNANHTSGNSVPAASLASQGRELFQRLTCVSCHINQVGVQAPRLEGIYGQMQTLQGGAKVRVDDNYLRESILHPNAKTVQGFSAVMPSYQGVISEEQLSALVAYIKSMGLSQGHAPERD